MIYFYILPSRDNVAFCFFDSAAVNILFTSLDVHMQEILWSPAVHVCACMCMCIWFKESFLTLRSSEYFCKNLLFCLWHLGL